MSWRRRRSRLWLMVLAGLVCAVLGAVMEARSALRPVELDSVDLRFRIRGDRPPPRDVVLVAIDATTLHDLGRLLPLRRRLHARAIDALTRAHARAVVYDVQFTEPTDAADDDALFAAVRRAGNVVLATADVREDGSTDVLGGPANVRAARARVGNAALSEADADRVVRRYAYATDGLPSLAVVGARRAWGVRATAKEMKGGAWIDYPGPPGTIDTIHFSDLLAGRVPAARLRGKVAVVGVTDPDAQDVHATPGSGAEVMSGAELQAHALETVRRGFPLHEPAGWVAALMAAAFGMAMPAGALAMRRWPLLVPAAVLVLAAAVQLAFQAGLILPLAAPAVALLLGTLAALAVDLATGARLRERTRAAFARFVPSQIVDDVLDRTGDDFRLAGSERDATVLFCDLRGFTTLAETLGAEGVIRVLDRYLTEMSDAILDHGGTVVSYMGDGIMAVFGAPVPAEDHAARALAAAREMAGPRLERFNSWLREEGLDDGLRMGVGVASGPVMSGSVGSDRRLEYAAVGDTTNLAARLEALTKQAGPDVLVAGSTRERASGDGLVAAGTFPVRGRSEPVECWTLSAEG
jgi:adenylate cyclase